MTDNTTSSRRQFIKNASLGGAALGSFSLPTWSNANDNNLKDVLPKWMSAPGKTFSNYGQPSPHEQHVIRWISANPVAQGNGVSWTPLHDLQGTITPNSLHYERHHNGVPQIDPAHHQLIIDGLVARPLVFSIEHLLRYPMVSRTCFIECGGNSNSGWKSNPAQSKAGYVHGLVSNSEWTGIPVKILLNEAQISDDATWVIAEGADASALNISIPIKKLLDDAILAFYQNGERLRPENGYPLRLVLPGWEGV
jgi:sulfane dehydrogenase subunit SoxC